MDVVVCVGARGPKLKIAQFFSITIYIYQVENHVIETGVQKCFEKGTGAAGIYILSDNQTALKAVKS